MMQEFDPKIFKKLYIPPSDSQGIVTALVNRIMERGYKLIKYQEKTKGEI